MGPKSKKQFKAISAREAAKKLKAIAKQGL